MFNQKIVLVTGAASGIGRETSMAFAEKGVVVAVSDINEEDLGETVKKIKKLGGDVLPVVANISDPEGIKTMVSRIVEKYGRLDIAVNNAGVGGALAATAEYTIEEWDRVININLRGQWLCMKYQIHAMLKNGGGSVVNIASILGKVGFANAPAYVAAKHGLVGLTKAAALEYSAKGIRINAIAPGFIETPLLEDAGLSTDQEMKQWLVDRHPIGRLGKPREVADAVVWLAADEASFVTGHTLLVDGGYTAQ